MAPKTALRTRTWGTRFDTLPSSPPSPEAIGARYAVTAGATEPATDAPGKRKEEKMPHDASVFVGSLPSNIEQPELTRMLSQHLSEHAEVKNIKVVRDSKGGVCAFVQCEDASSAASLIHTLHTTAPKPFLGRILRYEPARAFRTLLISYRTPTQFIPLSSMGDDDTASDYDKEGKTVELDLPYAMRLWRPRNSKFLNLLYNAEARDAENQATHDQAQQVGDSFTEAGLYLQPISFDAETVRKISAHFGPLEHFCPYKVPGVAKDEEEYNAQTVRSYPTPHNAPRTAGMDAGCWEIKWDHRDDCVSALMTLRRVPHLTVTWAHQPPSFGFEQSSNQNHRSSHRVTPYPFHVQDRIYYNPTHGDPFTATSITPTPHSSTVGGSGLTIQTRQIITATRDVRGTMTLLSPSSALHPDEHARKAQTELIHDPNSPRSKHKSTCLDGNNRNVGVSASARIDWTEMDFPPLGDMKGERKTDCGVWGEKITKTENEEAAMSPSSTLSPSTPRVTTEQLGNMDRASETTSLAYPDDERDLDLPPTPGFGMSPITPKTPGSLFPTTPTSQSGDLQAISFKEFESKEHIPHYSDTNRGEREVDPTTLFVGGLEPFGPGAWDEAKIGNFFAKFGGLENVKVVRPLNSRSAFAFVKFNNTESPARAVLEEHNRVYEGRAMRVQLRDCNPSHRGAWRYGRGRGRYLHQHFGTQRRYPEPAGKSPERTFAEDDQRQESDIVVQHDQSASGNDDPYAPSFVTLNNKDVTPVNLSARFDSALHEGVGQNEPLAHDESLEPRNTTSHHSSPQPSTAPCEASSRSEGYCEWYNETTTAALTPPPSFGSSASITPLGPVPATSYPITAAGYYPSSWMPPYPQQIPYSMSYFGCYPGYSMPGQQATPAFASPVGSDASGPAGPQNPWPMMGGMYNSYIPYPGYPPRAPNTDQSQQQQPNGQAPLLPTGFIQNEQGTLIAVYQPEALDQYMASAQLGPPPLSQPQPQNIPTWTQYPQPHPYPFPGPVPQMMSLPSRQFQGPPQSGANAGWIPSPSPLGLPPSQHAPHHSAHPSNMQNPVSSFRGAYHDTGGQPNTPQFRRQQLGRRDQHNTYNNANRNNNSRSNVNRYPPGNTNNTGHPRGVPQPPLTRPTQFNTTGEGGQWGAGR